jgi:archaetidylinositol phosphate synthase
VSSPEPRPGAAPYTEARRDLRGLTSGVEKRVLAFLAARMPAAIGPDHLTALGLLGMALCGLAYARAGRDPRWLLAVDLGLVVNWFGDSLDGSLARYRQKTRPRYGFYVDHVVDAFGALFLLGGLAASGLAHPAVPVALLLGVYLMFFHMALAAQTRGVFPMSKAGIGGTELRLLLILLNTAVMAWPVVPGTSLRTFDLVGGVGAVVLFVAVVVAAVQTGRILDKEERKW